MPVSKDIRLRVIAETQEFQRRMAQIPGITEQQAAKAAEKFAAEMIKAEREAAAAALRGAEQAVRAHEQVADAARVAGEEAESAFDKTTGKAGQLEGAIMGVAGALGMVSPEAQAAAMAVAELAGATDGLSKWAELFGNNIGTAARVSGILAVAVAAVGTAYVVVANQVQAATLEWERYHRVIQDVEADTRTLANSQQALRMASGGVDAMVGDLAMQTALMRGEISDTDIQAGELANTLADQLSPQLLAAAQAYQQNQKRIEDLAVVINTNREYTEEYQAALVELTQAKGVAPALKQNLEAIQGLHQEGLTAIHDYTRAIEEQRAAEAAAAEREAAQASAKAQRDADRARLAAELVAAQKEVDTATRAAQMSGLTGAERAIVLYDEQIARLGELALQHEELKGVETARTALEAQHIAELAAMQESYIEQIRAKQKAANDQQAAELLKQRQEMMGSLGDIGGFFGSVSELAQQAADARAEGDEEAAERAKLAAKRAARLEILASAAAGVINILGGYATRPLAAGIALTALGTATATQLAAVEKLHGGGFSPGMLLAPDEQWRGGGTVELETERTISPTGVRELGENNIRRAERGEPVMPEVVVAFPFGHFDRYGQQRLKAGNGVTREIKRGSTRGQRRN